MITFSVIGLFLFLILKSLNSILTFLVKITAGTPYVPQEALSIKNLIENNNSNLYYVIQKHKISENSLTQCIKFYLPVGSDFKDVTFQVYAELPFENLHSELNGSKNKYDGTWKFENFDTVEFLQEAQKAFGKNISLIRIDKEVVNC